MPDPYTIQYAPQAVTDIRALAAFDRAKIVGAIELHLTYEPKHESKSRIKRMTQPFWSQFRLRVDDFRVYYDVDDPQRRVNVLRVLHKGSGPTPEASP